MTAWGDMNQEMTPLPLDAETAERLLAGRVAVEDAPPGYGPVLRLLDAASADASAEELRRESEAVAAFAHTVRSSRASWSTRASMPFGLTRARLVALAIVAGLADRDGRGGRGLAPGRCPGHRLPRSGEARYLRAWRERTLWDAGRRPWRFRQNLRRALKARQLGHDVPRAGAIAAVRFCGRHGRPGPGGHGSSSLGPAWRGRNERRWGRRDGGPAPGADDECHRRRGEPGQPEAGRERSKPGCATRTGDGRSRPGGQGSTARPGGAGQPLRPQGGQASLDARRCGAARLTSRAGQRGSARRSSRPAERRSRLDHPAAASGPTSRGRWSGGLAEPTPGAAATPVLTSSLGLGLHDRTGSSEVATGNVTPLKGRGRASSVFDTLEPALLRGEVAQLVEHTAENRGVAGSIPALATGSRSEMAAEFPQESYAVQRNPVGAGLGASGLAGSRPGGSSSL